MDYEGSEDEETELPPAIFGCAQETSLKDVLLMAPELSSLVGSGEIDMREIESIQKNFLECIAQEKLRASLNESTP